MDTAKLDEIETRVSNAIRGAVDLARDTDPDNRPLWTRALNVAVMNVGDEMGYVVRVRPSTTAVTSGWLWDMTWLEFQGDALIDIPLAMESEWDTTPSEIQYDFQKLLVCKARLRVMICETSSAISEQIFDRLIREIQGFRATQPNDRYLLACYCYGCSPGRLDFRRYIAA